MTPRKPVSSKVCSPAFEIFPSLISALNVADSFMVFSLQRAAFWLAVLRRILVLCSEVLSRRVIGDLRDRNIAILVGDGAAAIVVQEGDRGVPRGVLDLKLGACGRHHSMLRTNRPGIAHGHFVPNAGSCFADFQFEMDGQQVREHAAATMIMAIKETLARNKISLSEVDRVICHQPNVRMVEQLAKAFHPHHGKFAMDSVTCGNMGSASLAVAWVRQARVAKAGSISLLVAYGSA